MNPDSVTGLWKSIPTSHANIQARRAFLVCLRRVKVECRATLLICITNKQPVVFSGVTTRAFAARGGP